jgi:cytochrome c oxidase cbb3-type subunit III
MSSRFPVSLAMLALVVLLGGCDREERHTRSKPIGETVPSGTSPTPLVPGQPAFSPQDPRATAYERNANAVSQGQQLFSQMNCVGCHAHGGGGMGPALMDDQWRYGGSMDQIAATISEGRPNGMPAWHGKLTPDQIWKLAAYVRSLSGQVRKDAVGARADAMSTGDPATETKREPVLPADSAQQ